jgi:hypothetical protein
MSCLGLGAFTERSPVPNVLDGFELIQESFLVSIFIVSCDQKCIEKLNAITGIFDSILVKNCEKSAGQG